MNIILNVTERKPLAALLGEYKNTKPKYLRAPSYGYQIGDLLLTRDGNIEGPDTMTKEEFDELLALLDAGGYRPEETDFHSAEEPEIEAAPTEETGLTITIPLDKVKVGNLTNLLDAKGSLIKHALHIEDLRFELNEDSISFPWFSELPEPDEVHAYSALIAALCKISKEQKRILPYFWIPEDTLELRVRRDHVPYDVWERQGFLETTEGNVVHYGYIEKFIERLGERFNIREIAFDRWGAVQMVQNLEGMGFTVVPFGQGFKDMSPPTKELMKLTLEQKLAHGGHPVLRWMMDNIYIRTDPAGNVKADKEKSTEKIDGAVATIMGLDRAIRCGNNTGASVYDGRGILFI